MLGSAACWVALPLVLRTTKYHFRNLRFKTGDVRGLKVKYKSNSSLGTKQYCEKHSECLIG
ncbi:hypothetical protein PF005_g33399 [Phytophthora fragariae]|uniref:Uncharacterized protein n=1 Tax=Phytophthora fragariae TaxID=53985 RepID=A0A6A3R1A5_9STRA|nr:hypothetical protein PF003_g6303 [Phytophthora fragariae]KAE8935188.1 hypothetical protein PF009_g14857 [Phytophthora fragariae]KAE9054515.1 hypothetical protein PF006_g33234 [Phytophthora fragariae]KAE9085391.1 hypothetical protein PF007_g21158 [Phytophthora fragariae]KAE9154126.1 hypothetical protein PF005_g33399 [Phytophthora fragariae]